MRNKVSYVPQRQEIDWDFPASVWDIVSMGRFHVRGLFKRLTSEDNEIIQESLEKVNMLGFAKRQISQLSGGQQQRVFLARAIAQQGELFLMDEPFAADRIQNHLVDIPCHPCSKLGSGDCPRGHFNCMKSHNIQNIVKNLPK